MRNIFYLLLAATLILALTQRSLVTTGASSLLAAGQQPTDQSGRPRQTTGLPSYDIRKEAGSLQPGQPRPLGVAIGRTNLEGRLKAIKSFRDQLSSGSGDNVRVIMNEAGMPKMVFNTEGPLSFPQSGAPDTIARNFLTANSEMFGLDQDQIIQMKMTNEDQDQGTTFINYEQTIDEIPVFQGQVQVAIDSTGQVMSVSEGLMIPEVRMNTTPRMSESEGMQRAFRFAGRQAPTSMEMIEGRSTKGDRATYRNPLGGGRENIISGMKIMRVGGQAMLAWHVYVDAGPSEWYEILLDANTGALLYRNNLYADVAQGAVFTVNGFGQRSLVSFVGNTTINTATGWLGTSTVTTGNNVDAYLDTNADNQPDAINTTTLRNGRAFSTTQNFSFPFTAGVDPRTERAASVANLFFFNNLMHDFVYRLGFTESAGNFQVNNFGRGGVGNDPVRAEAQDGSGVNNANFATPPDGTRPRMQMFLFTRGTADPNDDRDASFDGDVVLHEYGHGVSNRLVGGPANTSCLNGVQSAAMGEGWSDYFSITFYNDGVTGEYVTGNLTRGVRRAAYTVPANAIHNSYADLGNQGFEVHNDGEIWAATLWELRQTLGAAITDRLVVQGMKFTPCSPSFLNARDGILMADQNLNRGANRCTIWRVFARHGMGVSARGNDGTTHIAATDVPADCR